MPLSATEFSVKRISAVCVREKCARTPIIKIDHKLSIEQVKSSKAKPSQANRAEFWMAREHQIKSFNALNFIDNKWCEIFI